MLRLALTSCLLLSALPAAAGCVTSADLETGVVFRRDDGRQGLAIAKAGGVFIDYATGTGPWTDQRQTELGIYELSTSQYFQDDPDAVGGGSTDTTQNFRGTLAVPEPGQAWEGRVQTKGWQNNSSEAGGYDFAEKFNARYDFLAEKTVKISGCSYRVIPVEARFSGIESNYSRRWLYFPDLGFGLETMQDQTRIGLTALKPA